MEDVATPTGAEAERAAFGVNLRALRRGRGWTLQDLSRRSGLAISTLSKVERGRMALTYDRMVQLAGGLGLDLAELFPGGGARFSPGSFAVARRGEHRRQETGGYVYEMLFSELRHKAMVPMKGVIRARSTAEFEDFVRHPGQEFLLLLSGRLTVSVEGRAPVTLEPGDSLYFDSALGHLYLAAGEEDARILVVCTAAETGLS